MRAIEVLVKRAIAAGFCVVVLGMGGDVPVCGAQVATGEPAPTFTLADTQGTSRSLSEFTGHYVVLEWFNNECPFVGKHYNSGNMQRLQETQTARGVIWLTIASSAPGKQGAMTAERGQAVIRERGSHQTALLLDPDGSVGRRYGAKTTPHLFVINPEGHVIYQGAIDDRPSTKLEDAAAATNYVVQALDEAMAGKPVSVPETRSYGCSVKYE